LLLNPVITQNTKAWFGRLISKNHTLHQMADKAKEEAAVESKTTKAATKKNSG
jgi:hypothetical protein